MEDAATRLQDEDNEQARRRRKALLLLLGYRSSEVFHTLEGSEHDS